LLFLIDKKNKEKKTSDTIEILNDKYNEYFNDIKNDFLNSIKKKEYFTEFVKKSKYFYQLYFKYFISIKFPYVDLYQYLDSQLYKWGDENYDYDNVSILYLYFHHKKTYHKYNTGENEFQEIEFELNKIKDLYRNIIYEYGLLI
jgi:hypothetical protein